MASIEALQPQEAVRRTLHFVEQGVTGSLVPDALIAIRARHRFGIEGVRDSHQERKFKGLEEAYRAGGAPLMGRVLRGHLEDPQDIFPLPDEAGAIIERYNPNTHSRI